MSILDPERTAMDEATLRRHLKSHGDAIVAGDMDRVLEDFTDEVKPNVPAVAARLPRSLNAADILSLRRDGSHFVVQIRYSGQGVPLVVESTWEDRGGRPLIVAARPL
jgi:hypothetical protein